MASLPHVPRIRPVRRWLAWQGGQRPLLGVALPSFTPISLVEDPSHARHEWRRLLDAAADLRLDLVLLPDHLASRPELLAELAALVAERQLACLLPLDASRPLPELPDWGGLMALVRLRNRATDGEVIAQIEGDVGDRLRAARLPLAAGAVDPVMGAGAALRAAARTCDLTLAEIDPRAPSSPCHVLATCLAARPADRPLLVLVRTMDTEHLVPVSVAALAAGAAGLIVGRPRNSDWFPSSEDRTALARLVALRDSLPHEMGEPAPERAAVLVLSRQDGTRATPIEAVWGTLTLLHDGLRVTAGLLFDDRPDAPRPHLVWAPVNGALSERAWSLLWSLAMQGSHVAVSRLSLEGEATTARLRALGIQPVPMPAERWHEPCAWMGGAPPLDTEGKARSVRPPGGRGMLWFLDWGAEWAPSLPRSLALAKEVAAAAGVRPEPWLAAGSTTRRVLSLPEGELRFDLDGCTLAIEPTPPSGPRAAS